MTITNFTNATNAKIESASRQTSRCGCEGVIGIHEIEYEPQYYEKSVKWFRETDDEELQRGIEQIRSIPKDHPLTIGCDVSRLFQLKYSSISGL